MHSLKTLRVTEVLIPPSRQRQEYTGIEELAASIRRHGLLQPIGVTKEHVLVYGGRRLEAKKYLKHDLIDCVYVETMSGTEHKALEFEENFYRQNLTWQEECAAVKDFHEAKMASEDEWDAKRSGICLGLSDRTVLRYISVAEALKRQPSLNEFQTMGAALNFLDRQRERAKDAELHTLDDEEGDDDLTGLDFEGEDLEAGDLLVEVPEEPGAPRTRVEPYEEPALKVRPASKDIICADFREWAATYSGPRFTFIHCDFPYGVGHDKSDQGNAKAYGDFKDDPNTYWNLLDALLEHRERLVAPNAHILFWLSLTTLFDTTRAFERNGFRVDPYPLIWYKSDGVSMLPDPQRGARRTYEAALLVSYGDPKVVRPVANLVAWPANKEAAKHASEKPLGVMSHFLKMLVDKHTIMLDPTCGSGTALTTAAGLYALRVTGLDIDSRFVDTARAALNSRRLAMAGKSLEELEEEDRAEEATDDFLDEIVS